MTTIACDGKQVAADGLAQCQGSVIERDCIKLAERDGRVFGVAGWHGAFEPIMRWICDGADPEKLPKIEEFLVIEFRADVAHVYRNDLPYPDPYQYPCAFGSGQPYALAAMASGKDARGAIEVAAKLDPGTGGLIMSIKLPEPAE